VIWKNRGRFSDKIMLDQSKPRLADPASSREALGTGLVPRDDAIHREYVA